MTLVSFCDGSACLSLVDQNVEATFLSAAGTLNALNALFNPAIDILVRGNFLNCLFVNSMRDERDLFNADLWLNQITNYLFQPLRWSILWDDLSKAILSLRYVLFQLDDCLKSFSNNEEYPSKRNSLKSAVSGMKKWYIKKMLGKILLDQKHAVFRELVSLYCNYFDTKTSYELETFSMYLTDTYKYLNRCRMILKLLAD